jgi:hypothetical protein
MSEWLALETNIWENDKVLSVAAALNEDPDLVAFSFISVLTYVRANSPDGDLSDLGREALRLVLRWKGKSKSTALIDEMLRVEFLRDAPLRVGNFLEKHKLLLAAQRQAAYRRRRKAESVTPRYSNVTPRYQSVTDSDIDKDKELKSMSNSSESDTLVIEEEAVDLWPAWWLVYPRKDAKVTAEEMYRRLCRKRGVAVLLQQAAEHYALACKLVMREKKSIMLPTTFLNKRWVDYVKGISPGDPAYDEGKRERRQEGARAAPVVFAEEPEDLRPLGEVLKDAGPLAKALAARMKEEKS